MIEDLLQLNGLSIGILEQLSYHSQLGKSLKQNLHYFDRDTLLSELAKVTEWLAEQTVLEEIALDFRIKSTDSIELNKKNYPDMVGREMRIRYEKGMIRSKEEFEEVLRDVLCDSQGYK
jgi:putative GTP pyrophosphokinase